MNLKRIRVLQKIDGRDFSTNAYVLSNKKNAYIVDPGSDAKKIVKYINENSLNIIGILLTHGHFDHIGAISKLLISYDVPIYIHSEDTEMLFSYKKNMSKPIIAKEIYLKGSPKIVTLFGGETIYLDNDEINVIHTPGHTDGSVSFYLKSLNVVLTGDTLFHMGIGRTDFYGGSVRKLRESIFGKLANLPGDTIVHSGHGLQTNISRSINYIRESDIL